MIIAVSTNSRGIDSPVSPSFGRTNFWMLYDTIADERRVVEDPYADSLGDGGIQSATMLIEQNVGAVITGGIELDALRVLSAAGLTVCKCSGQTASEAVALYLRDELEKFSEIASANRRRLRDRRRRRLRGRN